MRKSFLKTCVFLWAGAVAVSPAGAQPAPDPAVEARIQRIVNNLAPIVVARGQGGSNVTLASRLAALHVPGISIAVIRDGKIEWARGFGVTSIGGAPVTAETLFQAGSVSKPVTAMGVLHLVQSGRLELDTDVNQYLKNWKVPETSFTAQKKVTVRELLSHSAGVNISGFGGYASGTPVPTLLQVLNGEKPSNSPAILVDTIPGTLFRYSGGGYLILQQAILDVTGKTFTDFMRDTVLGPAGMTHSTFEQPLAAARQRDAATPYDTNGAPVAGGFHTYPEMAAAGFWSTPSDLARYAIEIQKSLAGQSGRVLSTAMAKEMVKPGGLGGWGLGLEVGGAPGNPYFRHGGGDAGFVTTLIAYDKGDGIAIMTNGGNGLLNQQVLRTVALEYHWPDFTPKENSVADVAAKLLDAYDGYYRQDRFNVVRLSRNGNHLLGKQGAQDLGTIYPASDREWFFTNMPERLTFEVNGNGEVTSFVRHSGGVDLPAPRISAAQATRIAEEFAAKVKNQTPDANSDTELRLNIDGLRSGNPPYDRMAPGLASQTRRGLQRLQAQMVNFGPIKSMVFKGVTPIGADIYDVVYEKGAAQWRIITGPDGKAENLGFQVLP